MITNERQYKITKAALRKFENAVAAHEQAYRACLATGRGDCRIELDPAVMLTPELLAALALLAAVGLIPVAIKRWRRQRMQDDRSQPATSSSPGASRPVSARV